MLTSILSPFLRRTICFSRYIQIQRVQRVTFSNSVHRSMAQEFKVKDISSLKLNDGDMKQVELEGVENGKVLILKSNGKIHATSSNCTHYGAPLAKGVLSPDGKITCPWHGACFDVATGDVEDAPAIDPIAKFEIIERDGAVYVKGEEATIKSNRAKANTSCSTSSGENIVVIGGGSGATGFLHALRERGSKASVTLISREPNLPIDRTKLSKALIPDPEKILLRPQEWFDSASIKTVSDEVTGVDFDEKLVSTASGKTYPYAKLVLASGGTPKNLPLPGFKDLRNIFVLRYVTDVQAILAAVGERKGKKIIVIGSSFIGMEVGNSLAKENEVTIVGMEKTPLERVMGAKVGAIFQSTLEKNGVKFRMEAGVEKATPSASDPKAVGAVHLKDGAELPADLVIMGVGIAPATDYLKSSGIKLEEDGSLKTNSSFAVEGVQDVYAIGDIATFPYHGPGGDGAFVRIEHWNVSQNAGRAVGSAIANPKSTPKNFIPVFWSALGGQLRYCGNTMNGSDDLILNGEPQEGKFAAYYTKKDVVVAVATMGMDPIMTKCTVLMKQGKMLSKSDLEAGKDPLAA